MKGNMTYNEAKQLVSTAPARTDKPSKINKAMTMAQAVQIMSEAIESSIAEGKGDKGVPDWMEKRVYQVTQNRMRPKMPS
jgi:hypothetical protein